MARRLTRIVAAVLLAVAFPGLVQAQACLGRPGQGAGPFRVGAQYETAEGGSAFTFLAGGLGPRFVTEVGAGSVTYDNFNGSTLTVSGQLGFRVPSGRSGLFEICPFVGGALGYGPRDVQGTNLDVTTRSASGGLALGRVFGAERAVPIIPTLLIQAVSSSIILTDAVSTSRDTEHFGVLTFGLGLIAERKVGVQSWLSVPFGIDNGVSYGSTIILVLGRARTIE